MIVSESARLLFVHVQKTGGISVEDHLLEALPDARKVTGLAGRRHATWGEVLQAHPEYDGFWTFGFVRNPWARLWSWWEMIERQRVGVEKGRERTSRLVQGNPFWSEVIATIDTFEQFVLEGPDQHARLRTPQLDYLRIGDRQVDLIGRTESLEDDLRTVFERHGLPPFESVHFSNSGGRKKSGPYPEQYTPAMRDRVADLFAPDIEAFGYTFDATPTGRSSA